MKGSEIKQTAVSQCTPMHPLLPSILVIYPSRPPLLPLMHRGVARHFKEREIDVDAVAECCDVLRGAGLTEATTLAEPRWCCQMLRQSTLPDLDWNAAPA